MFYVCFALLGLCFLVFCLSSSQWTQSPASGRGVSSFIRSAPATLRHCSLLLTNCEVGLCIAPGQPLHVLGCWVHAIGCYSCLLLGISLAGFRGAGVCLGQCIMTRHTRDLPGPHDAIALQNVDGQTMYAGELWKNQPVLILCLRRLGCSMLSVRDVQQR